MLKKFVLTVVSLCIVVLSTGSVFASETGVDLSTFSKEWHLDVMMCIVEKGDGTAVYLENYTPKQETPLISFATPYDKSQIEKYDCTVPAETVEVCSVCGDKMAYADILYEVNDKCGHGIFCLTYYCPNDAFFVPDQFYVQCGCE